MRHLTGSCSDLCICKLMSNAELGGLACGVQPGRDPQGITLNPSPLDPGQQCHG